MNCPGKVFNGVLVGLILALSVCAAMAREQTTVASAQVQLPISPVETLKSRSRVHRLTKMRPGILRAGRGSRECMERWATRSYNASAHVSAGDVLSHF
jgi:hypothetical protein